MLLPGSPSTGWSGGLEADGEGRRNGLGEKGMDAEDWNPQLLGGWYQGNSPNAGLLPACPLLLSCFTTKPQKQKSPWEICVQSPPETRQVLVLRKPVWYRQTVLTLTHFISLPAVLGKGCHSVDRECDPESPGQGWRSP